VILLEKI